MNTLRTESRVIRRKVLAEVRIIQEGRTVAMTTCLPGTEAAAAGWLKRMLRHEPAPKKEDV
jgi:hypothetical protein